MSRARIPLALLAAYILAALSPTLAEAAGEAPGWSISSLAVPSNFEPGDEKGDQDYEVLIENSGGGHTDRSPITITDTLPGGIAVKAIHLVLTPADPIDASGACGTSEEPGEVTVVSCEVTEALPEPDEPALLWPSEEIRLVIDVGSGTASGPIANRAEVQGGGAEAASAESHNCVCAEPAGAGFQYYHADLLGEDGRPLSGAASHPFAYVTSFAVNTVPGPPGSTAPFVPAGGDLKDVEVALPPGLVGNPNAAERCTSQQFNSLHLFVFKGFNLIQNECPDGSAVGQVAVQQLEGEGVTIGAPLYNLIPPSGMPAQLGFQIEGLPVYIDASLRSGSDYGISARVHNTTQAKRLTAASVTIWGTTADPRHDRVRGHCYAGFTTGNCPAGLSAEVPFFRLPSSCIDPLTTTMAFDTWTDPATFISQSSGEEVPDGCEQVPFDPTIQARPTTNLADSPSGLRFDLHLPQKEHEAPGEPAEADLRDATVALPAGLSVNPASADGLGACGPAEVGLTTPLGQLPPHFTEAPADCPSSAKVGTLEAITPLLDHPVKGSVFLARQFENPFESLLAIYLVLEDPETGTFAKLAGKVTADPQTGQLTTAVSENPQLPLEDVRISLFEGARASLRTPPSCATYTTTSDLKPWSAPASGPDAAPADSFAIAAGPGGGCPSGALAPHLSAGLANPSAATYSPFSLRLTRDDGTGEFTALTATTPTGLAAKLAGVPYCPEAAIATALGRSRPGEGALEAASPSCPAASRVGSATAGAGAGPTPFYTSGPLYLAGPYRGAPLSLVAVVPAVAGPFDLGAVVDRIALRVDPETAQVSAVGDPLPSLLSGIPLDIRDIRAALERPSFTLAPTSCEPKAVQATVFGPSGASASASDRFQVGGCSALPFKPRLSLKLSGASRRGAHPALRATLTAKPGEANIAKASVALPHSEFLAQEHIRTICTRVQFAADACPPGSIYGKARAITPLLDAPLEGPVYLRSSSHPLPDMVIALHGQIDVDLVGRIDSHHGGIRTSFEAAPDAPVTKVILEMRGARKGLLVNSRNICKTTNRASVAMVAQSGKPHDFKAPLKADCKGR